MSSDDKKNAPTAEDISSVSVTSPAASAATSILAAAAAAIATTTTTITTPKTSSTASTTTASPASKAPKVPTSEYDCFIVLDFEATCDDHKPAGELLVTPATSEIIEFSWLCVAKNTLAILHEEQFYVKPVTTVLTPFCKKLTQITEEKLANGGTLQGAVTSMDSYITREILDQGKTFCFVTHGAWDLRIQLPREAKDKGIELPVYLREPILFDLKEEATKWIAHHSEVVLKSFSLEKMCEAFAVSQAGDLHSGISDSKTIVNIMKYLVAFAHPDVFTNATDPALLLKLFKNEESKIVKISSLSYDITQSELETFFTAHQLKPKELVMLSSHTNRPSGGGFAIFEKHTDALAALELNGQVLGTRSIEVAPSSKDAMAIQKGKLSSFQTAAKPNAPPASRPGDWTCNMCQFVNFSSRRACLKCSAPSPEGVLPSQPANFTSGDWMCTNAQCNFHNYASRTQCLRCGTVRPGISGGSGGGYGNGGPIASPHHHSHHSHHHHPYASGGGGGAPSITFRPGDWNCPNCNFQNFASRNQCMKCGTSAPGGGSGSGGHSGHGSHGGGYGGNGYNSSRGSNSGYSGYNDSGNQGYGGNQGGRGSYSSGPSYQSNSSPYTSGGGGGGGSGGSNGHSFRPGDWTCPSCNSHNFASRFQCMRCGLTKPTPRDSSSPAPSYGQQQSQGQSMSMKPGDWMCPNSQCGYHNFAKRSTCARCGASAPNQGSSIGGSNLGGGGGSSMGYYGTQQQLSTPPAPVQAQQGYSPLNPSYGSYGGPTYGTQPQQGYGSYGSQQYGAPQNRY
ncbi:hypothetical protein MVEG_07974 [Podila verticillata NRRL 6337]|nr:hypothetical protein MVEG_07974 [Podila verticillata NRRL 6337]